MSNILLKRIAFKDDEKTKGLMRDPQQVALLHMVANSVDAQELDKKVKECATCGTTLKYLNTETKHWGVVAVLPRNCQTCRIASNFNYDIDDGERNFD